MSDLLDDAAIRRAQCIAKIEEFLNIFSVGNDDLLFDSSWHEIIMESLFDPWSEIRKAVAKLLQSCQLIPISARQAILLKLIEHSTSKSYANSWQIIHGTILGFGALGRGDMPHSIRENIKTICFDALSSARLPIREASRHCLKDLNLLDSQVLAQVSLRIVEHASKDNKNSTENFSNYLDGLLGVLIDAISSSESNLLEPLEGANELSVFDTLDICTLHTSSTVRQSASHIFFKLYEYEYVRPKIYQLVIQIIDSAQHLDWKKIEAYMLIAEEILRSMSFKPMYFIDRHNSAIGTKTTDIEFLIASVSNAMPHTLVHEAFEVRRISCQILPSLARVCVLSRGCGHKNQLTVESCRDTESTINYSPLYNICKAAWVSEISKVVQHIGEVLSFSFSTLRSEELSLSPQFHSAHSSLKNDGIESTSHGESLASVAKYPMWALLTPGRLAEEEAKERFRKSLESIIEHSSECLGGAGRHGGESLIAGGIVQKCASFAYDGDNELTAPPMPPPQRPPHSLTIASTLLEIYASALPYLKEWQIKLSSTRKDAGSVASYLSADVLDAFLLTKAVNDYSNLVSGTSDHSDHMHNDPGNESEDVFDHWLNDMLTIQIQGRTASVVGGTDLKKANSSTIPDLNTHTSASVEEESNSAVVVAQERKDVEGWSTSDRDILMRVGVSVREPLKRDYSHSSGAHLSSESSNGYPGFPSYNNHSRSLLNKASDLNEWLCEACAPVLVAAFHYYVREHNDTGSESISMGSRMVSISMERLSFCSGLKLAAIVSQWLTMLTTHPRVLERRTTVQKNMYSLLAQLLDYCNAKRFVEVKKGVSPTYTTRPVSSKQEREPCSPVPDNSIKERLCAILQDLSNICALFSTERETLAALPSDFRVVADLIHSFRLCIELYAVTLDSNSHAMFLPPQLSNGNEKNGTSILHSSISRFLAERKVLISKVRSGVFNVKNKYSQIGSPIGNILSDIQIAPAMGPRESSITKLEKSELSDDGPANKAEGGPKDDDFSDWDEDSEDSSVENTKGSNQNDGPHQISYSILIADADYILTNLFEIDS